MVNRVRIQGGSAATMRVSLPGYDVDSADIDQLAFDSRFNGFSVFLRGSGSMGAETWTSISYPETLPTPPLAFVQWDLQTGVPGAVPFWNSPFFYNGDGINNSLRANSYVERLDLYQRFNYWTVSGALKVLTYRFILFRRPVG